MTIKHVALSGLLTFLLAVISVWADELEKPTAGEIQEEAREIAEAYSALNWFNGTVLVAQGGEPILEQSWGLADRESGRENANLTLYNLGSIIKNFTAVLVLKTIEQGQLSADDTLDRFDLGFVPDVASRITVQHLLQHRSGLPDIFTAEYRENQLAFDTVEKRLGLLVDAILLYEPGSKYHYSNYGYVILAAILQKVSGKSFDALLNEEIFVPLNLENSAYPYDENRPNQSRRYSFSHSGDQRFVGVTENHGPDGGIEATARDVLSFYRALYYTDAVLDRKHPVSNNHFYFHGEHWAAYGGGVGVSAAVEMDLANHYQIIVLSNTDQLVAELISGRILSFIRTGKYEDIRLPPQVFAYQAYCELGADAFRTGIRERYKAAGYEQFIGRTINEAGMSLVAEESWEAAMDFFETLRHFYPDAPQVYDSLAFVWFKRGDTRKARELFEMALAKQSDFDSDYSHENYGVRR